jgi:glycosyltransferase involved in cell wall biosynthesis
VLDWLAASDTVFSLGDSRNGSKIQIEKTPWATQRRDMTNNDRQIFVPKEKKLFLVWGTPDQGPRSRVMAAKLGIEVSLVQTRLPRGMWYAPIKYLVQAVKTMLLLLRKRPVVVFVQSPPLLAVLTTCFYCALTRSDYIVDAHSAAFHGPSWSLFPGWLRSLMARRAIATLVTNENFQQRVEELGGLGFILRDVPTSFPVNATYPTSRQFNIAMVNVFSPDEPLVETLNALADLSDVQLYVTGRINPRHFELVEGAPQNVHFTNFLPDEDYYGLLTSVQAVMCLTTRNHTMQRGACEALWLGKPIITSDWPVLRGYFDSGTVYVDNTSAGIRQGILQMKEDYARFQSGIQVLQTNRQREWHEKLAQLTSLVNKRLANRAAAE